VKGLQDGQVAILMSSGTHHYAVKRGATTLHKATGIMNYFSFRAVVVWIVTYMALKTPLD